MKKLVISVLAVCALAVPAQAQHNTRSEIMESTELAGGVYMMYPTDIESPTPAPKGYKPFYISHVGRHGARYALGDGVYDRVWAVWSRAAEFGWLTPYGQRFFADYKTVYPFLSGRDGILTLKGQEQHRQIARQMVRDYPEVFKGRTRANAVSTYSHRVIVSMFCCLGELSSLDRDFTYTANYSYPYQNYLLPEEIDNKLVFPDSVSRKRAAFIREQLDYDAILGKWFTRPDRLVTEPHNFIRDMYRIVCTLDNMDFDIPASLWEAFTPDELYRFWRVDNYRMYLNFGMSPEVENVKPLAMKLLWKDIVDNAEKDWADGLSLRLRFTHDGAIMPLMSLLDVNGRGARVHDPHEVENHWRNFDTPMAANFQLIFFRNPRSPEDVLVQVLVNGREATLPLPMAHPGSFYRWQDVKALL